MLNLLVIFFFSFSAWCAPFHGLPFEVRTVRATDGAELSLFHLKGRESGPVILLEPGLVETAEMLDGIADAFHRRGYDVFIGQVRLAGKGEHRSGEGSRNGIEEVTLLDFPAHLREVIRMAGGRDVHVFGHSMGGIEILAAFSDPALAAEFTPKVKAATLLAAPHDLSVLPAHIRIEARLMLPLFKTVRGLLGKSALGPHHTFFDFTRRMKESRNPIVVHSARAIEAWFIKIGTLVLNRMLIDVNHTSPAALRRLWFKEVSALPLDLLIDFAEAAREGRFVKRDGSPLLNPEKFELPVQVIRAEHDQLVPWKQQESLFRRLGSKVKRMISLFGMLHVDPVITDLKADGFLRRAIDFHDNAEVASRENPKLFFQPGAADCVKALTAP